MEYCENWFMGELGEFIVVRVSRRQESLGELALVVLVEGGYNQDNLGELQFRKYVEDGYYQENWRIQDMQNLEMQMGFIHMLGNVDQVAHIL